VAGIENGRFDVLASQLHQVGTILSL